MKRELSEWQKFHIEGQRRKLSEAEISTMWSEKTRRVKIEDLRNNGEEVPQGGWKI